MQQIVTPVETGTEKKILIEKPRENKTKCAYWKAYGHAREECKKLQRREDKSSSPSTGKNAIVCYGYGTLDYIRAKCPTCSEKKKNHINR